MITRYEITLRSDRPCTPRLEWGYRLYAALLAETPENFGADVHQGTVTPLSQFLTIGHSVITWTVNLLGSESERSLSAILDQQESLYLKKDQVKLTIAGCRKETVRDVDELFSKASIQNGCHLLWFQTPTAFKSQGQYLNLPTTRLIVQSLIQKWNGCFPECLIEDEDGQGMETIAAGLRCRHFKLRDQMYYLKGNSIPGFVGELMIENRLSGFHRELADVLLLFSNYAGIGIKTALGMGGVQHQSTSER